MQPTVTVTQDPAPYVPVVVAPVGRIRVGGYLTPIAAQGWEDFCTRHGCNMTAFLEAVGQALAAGEADEQALVAHVGEARRIEAERLRRRRT